MLRSTFLLLILLCSPLVSAEVRLLTSIKPLQLIAAAVQDGVSAPEVLLPPGASPHHYALRPSDVMRVRDAQLFYWIGPDMEVFLPRVLQGANQPGIAIQDLPGLQLRHFGEAQPATAEAQPMHADEPAEHDHDHRTGSLDVHLWLLPANAKVIAAKMAADLAALDPDNAPLYQANLLNFQQRLDALDQHLRISLTSIKGKPYFVFHETYDYFEAAYDLHHTGVFSLGSEIQPGAQRVARMRAALQAAGPACVFSEPPLQPRLAETLSAGLPVRLAELDALGSNVQLSAQGYEQMLQGLASGMLECLNRVEPSTGG